MPFSFGLTPEEEDRFRRYNIKKDLKQAELGVLILIVPSVGFVLNDLRFLGLSQQFYVVVALRLVLLLATSLLLVYTRKAKTYHSYDKGVFIWGLLATSIMLFINSTRPENFIAHSVIVGVAILIVGIVIPIKLAEQTILVSFCLLGEIGVIALSLQSTTLFEEPAFFTIMFSLTLASIVTILSSRQLHAYRRSNFKSIIQIEQMKSKIEDHAKNLENLVEEKTKQLKKSERYAAIGQTAGMVGHDLRNPLQAILGDLYLIAADVASLPECEEKKSIKEGIDAIEKSIAYMDKIIQDLQDYTRPLTPTVKKTDLEAICQELLLEADFPENIDAKYLLEEEAKEVVADPELLKRILSNLVSNAVQAMPEGGKLEIRSRQENGEAVISIQDSGVGVPAEHKDKLFTPLFTTKAKGQGFGLAVVKRLTEALGGMVTFESKEGKGTRFVIRLPTAKK